MKCYRNWLGLMKGDLIANFEKNGKKITRKLNPDRIYTSKDGWTILTKDGKPSAHFEHTIAITENGPIILSKGSK